MSNVQPISKTAASPEETLLGSITKMDSSLGILDDINLKANFIALNAAIEAARNQAQTENFTLVADQVRTQAQRTGELAVRLRGEVAHLENTALKAFAVRYADIAYDVIDKIDRNLFERNCDCQAWASFQEIVAVAKATQHANARVLRDAQDPTVPKKVIQATGATPDLLEAMAGANTKLKQLRDTYQVYLDVFVFNAKGILVAAGARTNLLGDDQSTREFFREVMEKKAVHVTDMYFSQSTQAFTVSYSAPIMDESGEAIGVLSTRFDWQYAQEMLDKLPLEPSSRVYVINQKGMTIAATGARGVLQDSLAWLDAGESAMEHQSGYSVECARNGRLSAWGYCHTFGYNAYKGKNWSSIVSHPLDLPENHFLHESIERDGSSYREASDNANDRLRQISDSIRDCVKAINAINNETNMLAINAAIQAGVAGAEGESFSVIASEIGKLARQSEDFVATINSLTEALGRCVESTVYQRLGEAAFDTMDKIDRNLFERFCDCQAFASFALVVRALTAKDAFADVQDLLRKAHQIYEVYHDIFLLDSDGQVVSAAVHREQIGRNYADQAWFRDALNGNVIYTDPYLSEEVKEMTVAFSAPVRDENGRVLGVLSTRFNCQFLLDIMRATVVGKGSEIFLVNSRGLTVASTDAESVLKRNFSHLKAFRTAQNQRLGFVIEKDTEEFDRPYAVGFAKGPGYNNYTGRGWICFVRKGIGGVL